MDPTTIAAAADDALLASWLAETGQGNARSFARFHDATIGKTQATVRRICSAHQDDVLSDTYLQIWQTAHHYQAHLGSPLAWLMTVARSRALDRLRRERVRHGGLPGAPAFEPDELAQPGGHGPDHALESKQNMQQLDSALRQLSGRQRWVVGLAYYRDCTHPEIAALTSLPLGTVKTLLLRSQVQLRRVLQPVGNAGAPCGASAGT